MCLVIECNLYISRYLGRRMRILGDGCLAVAGVVVLLDWMLFYFYQGCSFI